MKQMKHTQPVSVRPASPLERRETDRPSASVGLMYSALDGTEVVMGDGMVVDLSRGGLGIRGNRPVKPGMELTLFLYLPDGEDPLFVLDASVAWEHGRQFGVRFTRLGEREQKQLQAFLLTQRRQ